jgi:AcrR family transcriptional regulator
MALSRERILEAALGVVESDGWHALSMRRLAQELDVWPMAVYRYFQDKDALLDALAETAAERVSVPSARGSWRTRMSKLLREARGALGDQPASRARVAPPGATEALSSWLMPHRARLTDAGLRILHDAGFDETDRAKAWPALLAYALGFGSGHDDEFEFGLACLLDGLEARRPG